MAGVKKKTTPAMTAVPKKKTNLAMTLVGRHLVQLTSKLKCLTTNPKLINFSLVIMFLAEPALLAF